MPIIGIDYDKCINCGACLNACAHPDFRFKRDKNQDRILFGDPKKTCNLCGQCIAQCPENAILYEGMGETVTFDGVKNPEEIVSYEKILKFLIANRSIRQYKKTKVPLEDLNKVIKAMEYAPTGANMRTEQFTIISDQDKIKELSDAVQKEISPEFGEQLSSLEPIFRSPVYYDAPHVIFVSSPMNMVMEGFNMGIIITYGRLAAQALGLGTCWNGWTHLAIHKNPKIKKLANLRGYLATAFTIGYPDVKFYRIPPRSSKRIKVIE